MKSAEQGKAWKVQWDERRFEVPKTDNLMLRTPVFGIDPGVKGAVVGIFPDRIMYHPLPYRTDKFGSNLLCPMRWRQVILALPEHGLWVLERPQIMRTANGGRGAQGMLHYGMSYGYLKATLMTISDSPVLEVNPREWTKRLTSKEKGTHPKERALLAARRWFHGIDLKRTPRCSKADEGLVDALLIAAYGGVFFAEKNLTV